MPSITDNLCSMEGKPRLLILYASQTRNAQDAAEYIGREADRRHCHVVVLSMEDFDAAFWKFLLMRSLDQMWLEGMHYAVFGLGDSGYQKFNIVAKKLDKRLADLGAMPIIERGLGDDQHRSGYEVALDPWLASLWTTLREKFLNVFEQVALLLDLEMKDLDLPKFQIIYHDYPDNAADIKDEWIEHGRARAMVEAACNTNKLIIKESPGCDLFPHCFARMVESTKNVKSRLGLDKRDLLTQRPVKLRTLVESTMDIASASPHRYFFEVMSHFATAEHEKERLQYFASPEGRDDLYQYNQKERRTVLEVLEDFPSVHFPLEWLVQLVPRLRSRMFSISSLLLAHPKQVHLTVVVVSWMTPFKRKRYGLCSAWLAQLDPNKVLVGPGRGCAPFRAFIEQKAILSANEPAAPILFFFGCRNEARDFLYKDFWFSQMENCGVLSQERGGGFFVAFSRDQSQKVYVQHKLQDASSKVWNLLKSGAWVYIAGSATKMPGDVMSALEEIIAREGGFSKESTSRWLKQLEKVGRYHFEAWS
eukprot:Gb_02334 [translate_table: standard]